MVKTCGAESVCFEQSSPHNTGRLWRIPVASETARRRGFDGGVLVDEGSRALLVGRYHVQHARWAHHKHRLQETLRQGEAGVTRSERSRFDVSTVRGEGFSARVRGATAHRGQPSGCARPGRARSALHESARRRTARFASKSASTSTCVPVLARARKRRIRRGGLAEDDGDSSLPFLSL